jgi:hypothetical protein
MDSTYTGQGLRRLTRLLSQARESDASGKLAPPINLLFLSAIGTPPANLADSSCIPAALGWRRGGRLCQRRLSDQNCEPHHNNSTHNTNSCSHCPAPRHCNWGNGYSNKGECQRALSNPVSIHLRSSREVVTLGYSQDLMPDR